jgi:hypothetical protein
MSTPASRSLEAVLRSKLAPSDGIRLVVGEFDDPPADPRYASVIVNGETLEVPRPPAEAPGVAAYMLASPGRLLVLASAADSPGTAYSAFWRWTTSTANAASSGDVGINAASWAATTQINLNETNGAGSDTSNFLAQIDVGDQIYLQDQDDAANWGRFTITAPPTDQGTWRSWPVSYITSSGVPPNNNADTVVTFFTAGGQGSSSALTFVSGSGAPSASVGVDGSIYLDTASGRMWGPKATGAWPGSAFGRLVPLNPTYAQLRSG